MPYSSPSSVQFAHGFPAYFFVITIILNVCTIIRLHTWWVLNSSTTDSKPHMIVQQLINKTLESPIEALHTSHNGGVGALRSTSSSTSAIGQELCDACQCARNAYCNLCIRQEKIRMWLIIPFYNAIKQIDDAITSIQVQRSCCFVLKNVFIDDHSMDNSSAHVYARKWQDDVVLYTPAHCGPACSKWYGFEYVRRQAKPYEIVVIMDGDDKLSRRDSLEVIWKYHMKLNAWFTYGSMVGRYAEEIGRFPERDFRNSSWVYGHPRTFRAGLLSFLEMPDFLDSDGNFLQKGTERGFIYKFLELCGPRRIQYIREILYRYSTHRRNTVRTVSSELRLKQVARFKGAIPLQEISAIHVILCVFQRREVLPQLFDDLKAQTMSDRLHIHICVNNPELTDYIVNLQEQIKLRVTLHGFGKNTFGFGRFMVAQKLLERYLIDYFVFVDDDQHFPPEFMSELWAERLPQSYIGWFGKRFHGEKYWAKFSPSLAQIKAKSANHIDSFQYVGTGGSIIDASIFLSEEVFNCPLEYRMVEDLWLSHVVAAFGWERKRTLVQPLDRNLSASSTYQHADVRAKKQQLLSWILENNPRF
eukprot:scaffold458_cov424-Pavlova_lutheri.AAC.4